MLKKKYLKRKKQICRSTELALKIVLVGMYILETREKV